MVMRVLEERLAEAGKPCALLMSVHDINLAARFASHVLLFSNDGLVLAGPAGEVLHNVVGGFGVFEGNGGDLKVGLPQQSIHDGERFVHEPRRLAVYLEAAPSKITAVLESQQSVRQIFDYGWLHLFALQESDCFRYRKGTWARIG